MGVKELGRQVREPTHHHYHPLVFIVVVIINIIDILIGIIIIDIIIDPIDHWHHHWHDQNICSGDITAMQHGGQSATKTLLDPPRQLGLQWRTVPGDKCFGFWIWILKRDFVESPHHLEIGLT